MNSAVDKKTKKSKAINKGGKAKKSKSKDIQSPFITVKSHQRRRPVRRFKTSPTNPAKTLKSSPSSSSSSSSRPPSPAAVDWCDEEFSLALAISASESSIKVKREAGLPRNFIKNSSSSLARDIRSLPRFPSPSSSSTVDCSICLCNLGGVLNPAHVDTLPCMHSFHKGCIDKWRVVSTHCPICWLN